MADLYRAIGRRKKAVARIQMQDGSGKIIVNKKPIDKYFNDPLIIKDLMQPLTVLELDQKYDVSCLVNGGGMAGQAGAIRLAIANCLVKINADDKPKLRDAKLLTRDARVKERKKYGKYGARRSPQFTKR